MERTIRYMKCRHYSDCPILALYLVGRTKGCFEDCRFKDEGKESKLLIDVMSELQLLYNRLQLENNRLMAKKGVIDNV